MDIETHKKYIFCNQTLMLITKVLFVFKSEQSLEISQKICKLFTIWSAIFEYLMIFDFHQNFSATICSKTEICWNLFFKNRLTFMPGFSVRVKMIVNFSSFDVVCIMWRDVKIFLKMLEDLLINFYTKFHRNRLVRYRDTDVLVQTESRFFKTGSW